MLHTEKTHESSSCGIKNNSAGIPDQQIPHTSRITYFFSIQDIENFGNPEETSSDFEVSENIPGVESNFKASDYNY